MVTGVVLVVLLVGQVVSQGAQVVRRDAVERKDTKSPGLAAYLGAEDGPGGLSRWIGSMLPNSYYSKPKYRYPYYDRGGKGYLLYGYGEKDLYEYSVFKPLEGYY